MTVDGLNGLNGLNELFAAWVETVYNQRVHSETGQAPLSRFLAPGPPVLPTPAVLHEAFLWSERRTVTKTATVSLHGNHLRGRRRPGRGAESRLSSTLRPDRGPDPLPGAADGPGHRPPDRTTRPPRRRTRASTPAANCDRNRLPGAGRGRPGPGGVSHALTT